MPGNTPMTPPSWCAALGMVESELVSLLGKALTRDARRRQQSVVHAAGWLHTMVLHVHSDGAIKDDDNDDKNGKSN